MLPKIGTYTRRLEAKPIYTSHKGFTYNLLGKSAYDSITVCDNFDSFQACLYPTGILPKEPILYQVSKVDNRN